jgi:hypothetical protein
MFNTSRDWIRIWKETVAFSFSQVRERNEDWNGNLFTLAGNSPQKPNIYFPKSKQSRYTPWRRLRERMYSSYSFTTSALDGGEWSASRPGRALPPGKGPPVPIVQEAGWAPEPVWTQMLEEKSFAPAGDRTPIARIYYYNNLLSHYTKWNKETSYRDFCSCKFAPNFIARL